MTLYRDVDHGTAVWGHTTGVCSRALSLVVDFYRRKEPEFVCIRSQATWKHRTLQ